MLTANVPAAALTALGFGAVDYVLKPVDLEQLDRVVAAALGTVPPTVAQVTSRNRPTGGQLNFSGAPKDISGPDSAQIARHHYFCIERGRFSAS